jgi:hypothetical protein
MDTYACNRSTTYSHKYGLLRTPCTVLDKDTEEDLRICGGWKPIFVLSESSVAWGGASALRAYRYRDLKKTMAEEARGAPLKRKYRIPVSCPLKVIRTRWNSLLLVLVSALVSEYSVLLYVSARTT